MRVLIAPLKVREHYVSLSRQPVGTDGLHLPEQIAVPDISDDEAVDMYNVPIEEGALILHL